MKKKQQRDLLELKKRLEEANIKTDNLVYMPIVPMVGIDREYVIEEWFGMKVAKLISFKDEK